MNGFKLIQALLIDDITYINYSCGNKNILFEGAQGVFLDIDNPVYPNVSSSHVNVGRGNNWNSELILNDYNLIVKLLVLLKHI